MGYDDNSPRPFGLNQIKIVNMAGDTVVALEASKTLQFNLRLLTGELTGSDSLVAVASFVEAAEWSIEEGGIPMEAMPLLLGFALTETGSTPSRVNTLKIDAATALPYFKIYGKSLNEDEGDVHVKLFKCKITGNVEWGFAYGEFLMSGLSGIAVKDGENGVLDVVRNETAAALPDT